MGDVYDDLENYNDVNLINELKTQNAELKHKLGECVSCMDTLQKSILQDFDKLSAEFKLLETNYSSLLMIARAEIKRKTDMITNLNIEKDTLITSSRNVHDRKVRLKFYATNIVERGRTRNNRRDEAPKQTNKYERKECEPPPSESSSTATDVSHKLLATENRVIDNAKSSDKNVRKENDILKKDVFPDNREDYREGRLLAEGVNRQMAMLARQHFSKFSSDEEFENMYSALEPKATSMESFRDEPERGRKRTRDEPILTRDYCDKFDPQQRHSNYSESSRDRYSKSRTRFHANDRSGNRDKYELPQTNRNKFSPDRYRRGRKEYEEERYSQQYDRHRRLESPPKERHQHRSRERRHYTDKERADKKLHHRYNYPDPYSAKSDIHGEHNGPQNKKPRIEIYPKTDENRRLSDKQFSEEHHSIDIRDETSCQSPDYLHTDNVPTNEPIREIKSTAVTSLDDPRKSSKKYVRCTDRNKDILYTVSSNKIQLQPVDKSLWKLEKDELPEALAYKPSQLSDEFVSEIYMDIDMPISDSAVLSSDDKHLTDCQDFDKDILYNINNDLQETAKENDNDKLILTDTKEKKIHEGEKVQKSTKSKILKAKVKEKDKANNSDVTSAIGSKKSNIVDTNKYSAKNLDSNLLHLPYSPTNFSKNSELILDPSKLSENKDLSEPTLTESELLPDNETNRACKEASEMNLSNHREFDHKVFSIRHIIEGDLELSDETNDDTHLQSNIVENLRAHKKQKNKKKSRRGTSREKHSDLEANTRKTTSKEEKEKEEKPKNKFCELFGDSSSLITPEDLGIATTEVHAQPSDSYMPVSEDAQDGINENLTEILKEPAQGEIPKTDESTHPNISCHVTESSVLEKGRIDKATKECNVGSHDKKSKQIEHIIPSNNEVKESKELLSNDINQRTVVGVEKSILSEEKTVKSGERSTEIVNIMKPAKKTKNDRKTKELSMSIKKSKCNEDNILLTIEDPKETRIIKNHSTSDGERSGEMVNLMKPCIKDSKSNEDNILLTTGYPKETLLNKNHSTSDGERSGEMVNVMKPAKKTKNDQKAKELSMSIKKSKCNEDNILLTIEDPKETRINKNHSTSDGERSGEMVNLMKPTKKTKNDQKAKELAMIIKKPKCNEENVLLKTADPKETRINKNHSTSDGERSGEMVNLMKPAKKTKNDQKAKELSMIIKKQKCNEENVLLKTADPKETRICKNHSTSDEDRSGEMFNVMKSAKKTKNDQKPKEFAMSIKTSKSNEENILLKTADPKETRISKNHSRGESKTSISTSGNKQTATFKEISKEMINSDIPEVFDVTLVPNKSSSLIDTNKASEEKNIESEKSKETILDTRLEEIPNILPVTADPGLVQTVVMSTGTDTTLLKFDTTESIYAPLKALSTSTPAKELSTLSNCSELHINQATSCVDEKIANENPPFQYDSDVPDVRINYYRRRKKVQKK